MRQSAATPWSGRCEARQSLGESLYRSADLPIVVAVYEQAFYSLSELKRNFVERTVKVRRHCARGKFGNLNFGHLTRRLRL